MKYKIQHKYGVDWVTSSEVEGEKDRDYWLERFATCVPKVGEETRAVTRFDLWAEMHPLVSAEIKIAVMNYLLEKYKDYDFPEEMIDQLKSREYDNALRWVTE